MSHRPGDRILAQEPVVVALLKLSVDVLHSLEPNTHKNNDRGSTEATTHNS